MRSFAHIEVFVAAVEAGSFTIAARRLGVTPSAVSRRIAALERELGVPLLARTTRSLRLTNDGIGFHRRCARILDDLEEARSEVLSAGKKPAGVLRVDAPIALGRTLIAPKVPQFLRLYPDVSLELTFRDAFIDPVAEGVDVLVRIAAMTDSSLMVRRLAQSRIRICASPSYVERYGRPATPADLANHRCIGFMRDGRPDPWRFGGATASTVVDVRGNIHTNDVDVMLTSALAGNGIVAMFDFLVADALAQGTLLDLLPKSETIIRPIHALYPKNRHLVPKVKAFLDFLAGEVFPGRARR